MHEIGWRSERRAKENKFNVNVKKHTHVKARGNYIKQICIYVSLFYVFWREKKKKQLRFFLFLRIFQSRRFFRPINFISLYEKNFFYDLQLINFRLPSKTLFQWVIKKKRREERKKLSSVKVTFDCVPDFFLFLCFRLNLRWIFTEYLHAEFQQVPKWIDKNERANRK